MFLFAGFCFKVSAVPFHMWTPDVYEGAPTPVTAFFAAAPKIAAMAIFARATITAFPGITPQWQQIVVFVAIASMALGAFAAIGQHNIKRLMAYSSIGHMGFALIGLAAGTAEGMQGVLVYMAIYLAMTLGTFAVHPVDAPRPRAWSRRSATCRASRAPIRRWRSSWRCCCSRLPAFRRSPASSRNTTCSSARSKPGSMALAVIGVLASVVGAYYYLLIVKIMYFDEPAKGFDPMPVELKAVLGVAGLFNLLYFVYPAPLINAAGDRGEVAVLMQLDPTAPAAGARLIAHDTIGSTNAEALHAGARRRARAAVGHREAPDRRPRPARTGLGVGAGQSLCEPAADRSGAAERSPELSFVAALALHDAVGGRIPGLAGRAVAEMAE